MRIRLWKSRYFQPYCYCSTGRYWCLVYFVVDFLKLPRWRRLAWKTDKIAYYPYLYITTYSCQGPGKQFFIFVLSIFLSKGRRLGSLHIYELRSKAPKGTVVAMRFPRKPFVWHELRCSGISDESCPFRLFLPPSPFPLHPSVFRLPLLPANPRWRQPRTRFSKTSIVTKVLPVLILRALTIPFRPQAAIGRHIRRTLCGE